MGTLLIGGAIALAASLVVIAVLDVHGRPRWMARRCAAGRHAGRIRAATMGIDGETMIITEHLDCRWCTATWDRVRA